MGKWDNIYFMCLAIGVCTVLAIYKHDVGQCRTEAIKAQMPADDIIKLCGK
jgi:hypothetical protein